MMIDKLKKYAKKGVQIIFAVGSIVLIFGILHSAIFDPSRAQAAYDIGARSMLLIVAILLYICVFCNERV